MGNGKKIKKISNKKCNGVIKPKKDVVKNGRAKIKPHDNWEEM